jgi:hypothetical protein
MGDELPETLGTLETFELMLLRPAMLAIRSLGTRVWIFCSKFLTRARISETIWTPLFFEVVLVVEVLEKEVALARLRIGVIRLGRREPVDEPGLYTVPEVAERDDLRLLSGLSRLCTLDLCSTECEADLLNPFAFGVVTCDVLSVEGAKSASSKMGGVPVFMLSVGGGGIRFLSWRASAAAFSAAVVASVNRFLSMEISSFASGLT